LQQDTAQGCVQVAKHGDLPMNKHSQHYLELNPEPSLFWAGVRFIAYAINAVAVVYLTTVVLFSF
jgi:hypothetical protein